jgi:hypothetical protein
MKLHCAGLTRDLHLYTVAFVPERTTDAHRHDRVALPAQCADPAGRPVDHQLLAQLLGAILDECGLCTELLLVMLAEDALTTARLVELCCISAREQHDTTSPHTAPDIFGDTTPLPAQITQFLELTQAGLSSGSAALERRCREITPNQRRAVASYAMTVLVDQLLRPNRR